MVKINKQDVFRLWKKGSSDKMIAKKLGCTRENITIIRGQMNLRPVPQGEFKKSFVKNISKSDLIYIAGLIDGEGCISLSSRGNNKGFIPRFAIEMTDYDILDWLKSVMGPGNIYQRPHRNPNAKLTWVYCFSRLKDVRDFLELVLPFLKIKKGQAKLLIEFCNIRLSKSQFDGIDKREFEIKEEIKELNKKGI